MSCHLWRVTLVDYILGTPPWLPWLVFILALALLVVVLLAFVQWADEPRARKLLTPNQEKLRMRSNVRGEIVLFEISSAGNHPELRDRSRSSAVNSLGEFLKKGGPYDVGLHLEVSAGDPVRLRDWAFSLQTINGDEINCNLDDSAWPPPKTWHDQFPNAMPLSRVQATFLSSPNVYVVYCRLNIKVHLTLGQGHVEKLDSLRGTATDNAGRRFTFDLQPSRAPSLSGQSTSAPITLRAACFELARELRDMLAKVPEKLTLNEEMTYLQDDFVTKIWPRYTGLKERLRVALPRFQIQSEAEHWTYTKQNVQDIADNLDEEANRVASDFLV